jgi:hypothetical protein
VMIETSCSTERDPKTTATLFFIGISLHRLDEGYTSRKAC